MEIPKEPDCVPMEATEEIEIDIDNPSRTVKVGRKPTIKFSDVAKKVH